MKPSHAEDEKCFENIKQPHVPFLTGYTYIRLFGEAW